MVVVVIAVSSRHVAAVLAALGAGVTLAGCGHPADSNSAPASSSASSAPAQPAAAHAYDISRVDNVKDDLPPGFTAQAHPAKTLQENDIATSGVTAFTGAQIDPPQCRAAVIPPYVDPTVGTDAAGVRADGDQGNIYVVALRSPQPVAVGQPPAGCDRISMSGSAEATGSVERVPAPQIGGVATTGVKLTVDDPQEDPDYLYTAALDDRTSVVVMGSADTQLDPQRLLSDLLVKAVAAVRGQ